MTDTLVSEHTVFTDGMLAPARRPPAAIQWPRLPSGAPLCVGCGRGFYPIHNNKSARGSGETHCRACRNALRAASEVNDAQN